jgi:hypothetical protein
MLVWWGGLNTGPGAGDLGSFDWRGKSGAILRVLFRVHCGLSMATLSLVGMYPVRYQIDLLRTSSIPIHAAWFSATGFHCRTTSVVNVLLRSCTTMAPAVSRSRRAAR